MKAYIKEILIGLLIIITLIIGIAYFYRNIREKKQTELIDLYTLVANAPEGLIKINRPHIASSLIFAQEEIKKILNPSIPGIYLSLIEHCPSPSVISLHHQGVVFYSKADDKTVGQIQKKVLDTHFPSYMPYKEEIGGIVYHLYPDTANRFFSYYHQNGILVASYNLRLLEEVAVKLKNKSPHTCYLYTKTEAFDPNAPVNILLPTNKLNLHIPLNDSLVWYSRKEWLTADIFLNDGKICCYGNMEVPFPIDTLYLPVAIDTLSRQLEKIFPAWKIESQILQEEGLLYYTGCTTNPS